MISAVWEVFVWREFAKAPAGSRRLNPLVFHLFVAWLAVVAIALPAQTVDATPSNQLIRQYFPWGTDPFSCTRSKPSQGSVPADST
jgi:hypothetical protein